jgi:hypothetical protein
MKVLRSPWFRRTVVGVLAGSCITALAATYAKVRVVRMPFLEALGEAGGDVLLDPLSMAFLVAPFAALAVFAPLFATEVSSPWRWSFVAIAALALVGFYFNGFVTSEYALQQRKWTAAALSVGLMPFVSLFFMLGAALVAALGKAFGQRNIY